MSLRLRKGDQASCLQALQEFFGVGMLVANRRYDDHREPCIAMSFVDARTCWRGSFRSSSGIRCSAKQQNFEKFARCVELAAGGRHLTAEGLVEILELAQTMNRRKPHQEMIRILRGHTPDIRDTG